MANDEWLEAETRLFALRLKIANIGAKDRPTPLELESLPDLLAQIEPAERAVGEAWAALLESLRGYV